MSSLLKKLRLKFIATSTGIVALMVIIIATTYTISEYTNASTEVTSDLDRAITLSISQPNGKRQAPNEGDAPNPNEGNIPGNAEDNQRIDLFRGKAALVYSVVMDSTGTVLRVDSPAIELDQTVLENSISTILASSDFKTDNGSLTQGRLSSEDLFYETKVQDKLIYLSLTDAKVFDERVHNALLGSLALSGIALFLTAVISFFLARLALKPVEEAWNKQRRFIADASHELKTPLTVIMANTEIVRSYPDTPVAQQMKWLEGITAESNRMQGLIADLLLLARMDDEKTAAPSAEKETANFSEMVENTLVSFEAIAFERNISIEQSLTPDIKVKAMRSQLVRLPDILLDNACKYANEGGTVRVTLEQKGDKALLRVFNTGSTISPEDMQHLFDRFYRADEARSDDIPGYGLGLSIAQSIAQEAKGTLTAENNDGKGVTFTVILPRVS